MTGVGWPWALTLALGAAVTSLGLSRWTLPRLAEPEPLDPPGKVAYRALATPAFVVVVAALTGTAAAVSALSLPAAVQPLWWVLAVTGVLLVAIDARTTCLPVPLTRGAWIGMAGAVGVSMIVTGGDWGVPIRAAAGAAGAGLPFYLVWRFAHLIARIPWLPRALRSAQYGIGFGDVRFVPLIGAAAAAHSFSLLYLAVFLGGLAGAVHALTLLGRGRKDFFPYAPALLVGPYAACLTEWMR